MCPDAHAPRAPSRQRLGDVLVAEGLISSSALSEALAEQARTGARLGEVLVEQGALTESQLRVALARQLGVDAVDLEEQVPDFDAGRLVRESFARRAQVLPVGWEDGRLLVAMANPADVFALDDVRSMTGHEVRPVMADPAQLGRAIDRVWSTSRDTMLRLAAEAGTEEPAAETLPATAEDGPVVQFVHELLGRALNERASDIHLEPGERALRVRFRIDGVLQDVMTVPRSIQASIVSRVKVMSDLDIAERRVPQDGRLTASIGSEQVDLRVVSLPTAEGESVVVRVLHRSRGLLSIGELGFLPETLARWRTCFQRPWGAVIVAGPTGSGKSTTLYATLTELNDPRRSIVTVEDPVEYRVTGVKQLQVNRKAGLTFASALRSILRADPDVILVGEIRDRETATIAVEAALTGHLVLTSLHTNDAAATPARLIDMAVEPFLVTSAITGVLAQRLVRRLCERCKEPYSASPDELAGAGWTDELAGSAPPAFHRAVGCGACSRSGYRGRFAVHEVMPLTEELRHLILTRASSDEVREWAVEQGMVTMREDGLRKAAAGLTTLEELVRVVL